MYSKLRCFIYLFIAFMLSGAGILAAHGQTTESAAKPATATLRGHITDPTGALIPGTTITVTSAKGTATFKATADAAGGYTISGLVPGDYVVQASAEGFAPFVSTPIALAAGQIKRVDISMAIEAAQQSVTVTDEGAPTVSVEAGANASSIVLKDKDLDALSDDPDELQNELEALAGPSAGPNGGQIYIDGFTGGQLPPKSAIREIRINQNPFSAEFDRLGYGRIEILTKPGTDKLHGRFFGMGNDKSFNTGNPFTKNIPGYHTIMFNGSLSGSLNKTTSFFFSVEQRNNQNASVYTVNIPVLDPSTGLYSIPTDANGVVIPTTGSIFNPSTHTEISPRFDFQIGQKNTVTVRYQFFRYNQSGGISSTALPSQSSSSDSTEHTIQLSDSIIVNDHMVNETRFEYRRGISSSTPVSAAPTVSVSGEFTGGGNGGQHSADHTDHFELQNFTTMTVGTHAIKFGTWMRDNRDASSSNGGFNGSFSFNSLSAYVATLNGMAQGQSVAQIQASCTDKQNGCTPNKLSYHTGRQGFTANVYDAALFFQDDWKVNPFLTLSGGLRWESQNHASDHSDWAPRVAFAYALDGHKDKKQAKTVLRGGFGLFYDRFGTSSLMSLERFNGGPNSQVQTVVNNPTCFSATSLNDISGGLGSCGSGQAVAPQIQQLVPKYHSPYTEQFGVSVERQLTKVATLTVTYLHSYGVHQMATRNANAYLPGTFQYDNQTQYPGVRPNPSLGIVDEIYPEAIFKQNQLTMNINARFTPNFGIMGFYNITSANSNTGTASNSYDLKQDYGRASFVRPQMLFLMGNYSGPWGLTFNPFLVAQAGHPYNLTVPYDLTGDNFFDSRPAYASSSSNPTNVVQTSFGALDTIPQPGETLVQVNKGTGPASVAVNMRLSRSFGLGPKLEGANAGGPPPPGGGGRGGHGGRGFGGPFGGGMRGGMRGGMSNTGRKYSLTFSAQALNLFNNIDYGTPVGNVVAQNFGKSTSLAGGIFSTSSAARRVFFQAAFQF